MWNTIALGIILLSSVLLAHSYGIFTMLTVYVSINILWLLTWHYFVWQEIGLKLRHALMDILPYAAIAATVMVITYYTTRSIDAEDLSPRIEANSPRVPWTHEVVK